VAAGGDGTVNTLLQVLMSIADQSQPVRLGAIALGSSNDFHKPTHVEDLVKGISCRLDFGQTESRDIGLLEYEDDHGEWQKLYWIVNAGMGITADANARFNHPDDTLLALKRHWTGAAIGYAAVRTILSNRSRHRLVQIADGPVHTARITNLAVVKSPHFSGSFRYDSPFEPSSGHFFVHLCDDMSTARTLVTLGHLSRGRFRDLPATRSWEADRLQVSAETPFAIEFDGEVIESKKVVFSLAKERLEVCRQ
jgi:diacylglycerol kinase family enzyme